MARKSYKQKYQDLLSETQIDMKINRHAKSYIYIPFSWGWIGRFFAFLCSLGLSIANFFLLIYTWKLLKLGGLNEEDITGFNQLLIIYPLIGQYIFVGLAVVCLAALIKGGFNKLKKFENEGLIFGSIVWLIFGLIVGLIAGLIFGLIAGLIFGSIVWLIFGAIAGVFFGVFFGIFYGSLIGLVGEFE